jgi:hypothetical protein
MTAAGLPPPVTFQAIPASLGAIPDHGGACQTAPFDALRQVSFNVTGLDGSVRDVELSMVFGNPVHPFMGDIHVRLIAPDGTSHVIFGRTGATTTFGNGDSSDLSGPYIFRDNANAPNGGWWQTATLTGSTTPMPSGAYRTTDSGGNGEPDPQPATLMNSRFRNVSNPNGFWLLEIRDQCGGDVGGITAASLKLSIIPARSRADFDGDGRTDMSVFRPSDGVWYLAKSTEGFSGAAWGTSGDIPAPGDFDGDGREDVAIFRPSTGTWWILKSGGGLTTYNWGVSGDVPATGDYDGDGTSDIAVFRPSNHFWYVVLSSTGGQSFISFGAVGDLPVPGDYSGDGITDMAVYRPSNGTWWINNLSSRYLYDFGTATDKPVPADYDGDNKTDIAVWRPSTGQWWFIRSSSGTASTINVVTWGASGDIPVPGDYDGDEKDDQAVYRNGVWWINRSTAGVIAHSFGLGGDVPIPSKYIPQ